MKRLTLTFDNGPDPRVTPRVLDVLRERGLKAHFFVLGKFIATPEGRALAERARDEGHLVGNHSYTHETPLGDDTRTDAVSAEIVATESLLEPLALDARRFRPFGGGGKIGPHLLSRDAVTYLLAHDYACVLWNSVPRDWEDQRGWPERAVADLDRNSHTVLVLHDIENACLDALPSFLDRVERLGDVDITLELPAECVPLAGGKVRGDLGSLVAKGDS